MCTFLLYTKGYQQQYFSAPEVSVAVRKPVLRQKLSIKLFMVLFSYFEQGSATFNVPHLLQIISSAQVIWIRFIEND